jgi:membrane protease YdiL (CAAX protease family)
VKWRTGRSIGFAVVEDATPRPSYPRLAGWTAFVALIALLNYSSRLSGGTKNSSSHLSLYSYTTFVGGLTLYLIWFGIVFLIALNRFDLFALRSPGRWGRALGLAAGVIVAIFVVEAAVSKLPLPQSPGKEQGITSVNWEPQHAGAFAANFVLLAVVAPFVEEMTFRGVGQSLLRFLGRAPSIVLVGVAFGLAHGLLEGLLVLIPFGIGLAWLRDRTQSVIPGMIVHALYNSLALVAVLAQHSSS